jgi:FKBP-type peptidyl-prolyl cis-trans isomerase FklB
MADSNEKMVSYGMGWQFGRHLLTHNFEGLDLEAAFAGARDCVEDRESPYTDQQVEQAFKTIAGQVESARQEEAIKLASKTEEFLAENAKKPDVETTASGLQYRIVERGTGGKPGPLDSVVVHYHGMLINGDVFDSSVERGVPAEFPVQQVIPGWTEALQLIAVGTKCRIFVPPELAYGKAGSPPKIPGNAALIFDIELLEIV